MTRSMTIAWAVVASLTLYLHSASGQGKPATPAAAPAKTAEKVPEKKEPEMPPKPGEETKKLQFLVGTLTGTGKMEAGAMKPGSPEVATKAKHVCKWTLGNLWIVCDVTDTAGTGKDAMTWMG